MPSEAWDKKLSLTQPGDQQLKGELQPTPIARKANRLLRSPLEVAWLGYHVIHTTQQSGNNNNNILFNYIQLH
ncbi:hypothetical protein J6590_039024 [Homalodisca vitripennis]|nr:hypothetical protein J6590_039024 [Homalodisca vitripennis]